MCKHLCRRRPYLVHAQVSAVCDAARGEEVVAHTKQLVARRDIVAERNHQVPAAIPKLFPREDKTRGLCVSGDPRCARASDGDAKKCPLCGTIGRAKEALPGLRMMEWMPSEIVCFHIVGCMRLQFSMIA